MTGLEGTQGQKGEPGRDGNPGEKGNEGAPGPPGKSDEFSPHDVRIHFLVILIVFHFSFGDFLYAIVVKGRSPNLITRL